MRFRAEYENFRPESISLPRQAAIVNIVGPAGLGKSWLARQLFQTSQTPGMFMRDVNFVRDGVVPATLRLARCLLRANACVLVDEMYVAPRWIQKTLMAIMLSPFLRSKVILCSLDGANMIPKCAHPQVETVFLKRILFPCLKLPSHLSRVREFLLAHPEGSVQNITDSDLHVVAIAAMGLRRRLLSYAFGIAKIPAPDLLALVTRKKVEHLRRARWILPYLRKAVSSSSGPQVSFLISEGLEAQASICDLIRLNVLHRIEGSQFVMDSLIFSYLTGKSMEDYNDYVSFAPVLLPPPSLGSRVLHQILLITGTWSWRRGDS